MELYPEMLFIKKKHTVLITMDVDQAYAFKHKSFVHLIGASIKNIFKGNYKKQRAVLQKSEGDPYDHFSFIMENLSANKLDSVFFIHMGSTHKNDPKPIKKIAFYNLLNTLKEKSNIGLHPSYLSNNAISILRQEAQKLTGILGQNVSKSRQHFMKIQLPQTYEQIINIGIQEDYSMGYPEVSGFRAGTSSSFEWFNLNTNNPTRLNIHPFWLMDIHLHNNSINLKQVLAKVDELKAHKLSHSLVFHSHFFGLDGNLNKNKEAFTKILKYAS